MFRFKEKIFAIIAYFYLSLPILIFFCGWIKPSLSIILVLIILISLFLSIKNDTANDAIVRLFNKKNCTGFIIIVSGIILLWILLSGIGGYVYQNSDHKTRNSIMAELIHSEWPVLGYTHSDGLKQYMGMCYYFGFWLPSALIGKLFGAQLGNYALIIWTFLGVMLVVLSVCALVKKNDYKIVLFFIFFSGLDYMRLLLIGDTSINVFGVEHIEWWNALQYSSHTTQLFWVFNQCIYGWLATVLILLQKKKNNLVFIMGCLLFNSTFSFIGLIPYVLYYMLKGVRQIDFAFIREIFTFQNVLGGGCTGIVTYLFLSGGTYGGIELNVGGSSFVSYIVQVVVFILIEVGAYIFLLWDKEKNNLLYIITVISLCAIPFFRLHDNVTNDFVTRASVPSLLVLMVFLLQYLYDDQVMKIKKITIIIVFAIGSVTAIHEFARTFSYIGKEYNNITLTKQRLLVPGNIANAPDTFFWTHMAKQNSDSQRECFRDVNLYTLVGYTDSEFRFITINDKQAMGLSGTTDLHIYGKIENDIMVTLYCVNSEEYDLNQITIMMNGQTGQIEEGNGVGIYREKFDLEIANDEENVVKIILPDEVEIPVYYISINNVN